MDDELIVAGYDGSPGARAAVVHALQDAARRVGRVRVVWAFRRPDYWTELYGLVLQVELPDVAYRLESRAHACVEEIVAADPRLAGVPVEVRAVCGPPGKVLVSEAESAAGLVLGHRGLSGVAGAVVGSVGLHCVLHAACPVTVVRGAPQPSPVGETASGPAVPASTTP